MKKIFYLLVISIITIYSCKNTTNNNDEMATETNPLLRNFDSEFGIPNFDSIKTEHYIPAVEKAMKMQNEEIEKLTSSKEEPNFQNVIEAYINSGYKLNVVTTIFYNMTGINSTEEIQQVSEKLGPMLSNHDDAITLNPKLFEKIKAVYDKKTTLNLTSEQDYLLDNLYKEFVNNGALLSQSEKEKLTKINEELSSLTVKFDQNLLSETNSFKLIVTKKEDLAGLPENVIATAKESAEKEGMPENWIFTTHKASMIPFIQYAQNRELREKLYKAYINRANNGNDKDNKDVIARIVQLRVLKAKLLGFDNYASYVLEKRMAKNQENVFNLLNNLWEKSLNVAKKEAKELQDIINKEGGKFKLESWDWFYYAEKLRKQKYNLEESEVSPYFKLDNVLDGVFYVLNNLYGLTFTKLDNVAIPHPESTAYEVKEADGSHKAILYLDFFPRATKEGGAWCNEYRPHHLYNGKEIQPITTVVCNFTKPTKDTPSLLTMDEVETLFHEFGHAVESMVAKNSYIKSFVARDFVELPSQILEHWAYEKDVLKYYAKHYKTGEVISDALIQKIHNSSLFNQGFATTEYLAASLLDMAFHTISDTAKIDVAKFETDYFNKIGLIPEIVSRYRSTYFGHITGGYAAGYHGYIWAGVLDNDAFEAFKEKGIFDKATAESFRKNILEVDGIEDPVKMYVNFRGREAKIDALLKNRGLL